MCTRTTPQGGVGKPAAAGGKAAAAGGGISTAGGVGVGLEEEIKKLQRQQKFAKLSEKDEKKLEGLQKKLEDQKLKQRLALDRVSSRAACRDHDAPLALVLVRFMHLLVLPFLASALG
jgi:hypothetical protein